MKKKKQPKKKILDFLLVNKMLLMGGRGGGYFNQAGGNSRPTVILFWPYSYILNDILSKLQLVSLAKLYSPRMRDGEMERFCACLY